MGRVEQLCAGSVGHEALTQVKLFSQQECPHMVSRFRLVAAMVMFPVCSLALLAQDALAPSLTGAVPPKTWVDKDTGHRVWRVSDEPNSGAFYFNVNAYTPDNKQMVYNSPRRHPWCWTSRR